MKINTVYQELDRSIHTGPRNALCIRRRAYAAHVPNLRAGGLEIPEALALKLHTVELPGYSDDAIHTNQALYENSARHVYRPLADQALGDPILIVTGKHFPQAQVTGQRCRLRDTVSGGLENHHWSTSYD